jgi:hypothetical protein
MTLTRRPVDQRRRTVRRPSVVWTAAVALMVLVLAGCSMTGGGGDTASEPEAADTSQDESSAGNDTGAGDHGDDGSNAPQAPGGVDSSTAFQPRKISRGEVEVEVDDLNKASQQVRDLAAGLGGYVSDESIGISQASYPGDSEGLEGDTEGEAPGSQVARPGEARLTLRLPPEATTNGMNEIAALGDEVSRWKSDTEVELTLVDLESRIATQTKSVQDITALMDRATSLAEIVSLESEVSSRTAELESLKSRRASISGQAQMSTVTAVLRTPERVEAAAAEEDETGFLSGLSSGWNALEASVSVLLTIVGAMLPFALVGALVGYPIYRVVRSRRRKAPVPVAETAA